MEDVGAATPLCGADAIFVAALPLSHQNTQVVVIVHLEQEEDTLLIRFFLCLCTVKPQGKYLQTDSSRVADQISDTLGT